VNAQGGVHGNKIRFVREDDQYKPAETVRLIRLVAERDKPVAFVNLLGSANVLALLQDKTLDRLAFPPLVSHQAPKVCASRAAPTCFTCKRGIAIKSMPS